MTARQVTAQEKYRCAELIWTILDNASRLVYAKDTGVWRVLPHQHAISLSRCNKFDTLENHARARCREFGFGANVVETVRTRLVEWAEAGLMIGFRELLQLCQPVTQSAEANETITTIGYVTLGRPALLQRGVASFIENTQRYGRRPVFVIMDDTADPDTRQSCRATLRALTQRSGAVIEYGDRDGRKEFAAALAAESAVPAAVVEFALFGPPGNWHTAANFNALLLETAGELIFRVDDDVLAEVAAPPDPLLGLRFFTEQEPAEFWFFNDHESALQSVRFEEQDILGLHEQFLGKTLGACLSAAAGGPVVLDQITAAWVRRSASGGGQVLLTMSGLLGDCGMTWPRWYVLDEPSRGRLVQSENAYRAAFVSREVLRASRMAAIGSGTFCMTYGIGVDNRALLPPAFPVGRGYDGLFGQMTHHCAPEGLFCHLPWAIRHAPLEKRTFPPQVVRTDAAAQGLTNLISLCVGKCWLGMSERTAADCLTIMGRQLVSFAAQPLPEFEEWLRLALWGRAQQDLRIIEGWLQQWGALPAYWATDLRDYHATLTEAMQRREYVVPREMRMDRTVEEALAILRQWLGLFGELLQAWPALVESARRLRGNGRKMANRL